MSELEKFIKDSGMTTRDYLITMLADDDFFVLAFHNINFNILGKCVPKEYLLVRINNLEKRGLLKIKKN